MARVNVEERALAESRLLVLMRTMRWRRAQAIGTLVLLWHDSQELLLTHATRQQVIDWVDARNEKEGEKVVAALIRAGYLDPMSDGLLHVKGNKKHVDAHASIRSGAQKGGQRSGESRKNNKLPQPRVQAKRTHPPSGVEVNSMQCNSVQDSSVQDSATQDKSVHEIQNILPSTPVGAVVAELFNGHDEINAMVAGVPRETQRAWLKRYPKGPEWILHEFGRAHSWMSDNPEKKPKLLSRFLSDWLRNAHVGKKSDDPQANRRTWESYSDAFKIRWRVDPTRNAKVNACISQFVKRVGAEDAPDVIRFYVDHNDGFYLKNQHPVALAVRDAEGLRTQWLRGKAITSNDVRQFEKQDHFRSQLERIDRGEI